MKKIVVSFRSVNYGFWMDRQYFKPMDKTKREDKRDYKITEVLYASRHMGSQALVVTAITLRLKIKS